MGKCYTVGCQTHTSSKYCIEHTRVEEVTGTPDTLYGAIMNGLFSPSYETYCRDAEAVATSVEKHVRDLINQKLGVLMLSSNAAEVEAAGKMKDMLFNNGGGA